MLGVDAGLLTTRPSPRREKLGIRSVLHMILCEVFSTVLD